MPKDNFLTLLSLLEDKLGQLLLHEEFAEVCEHLDTTRGLTEQIVVPLGALYRVGLSESIPVGAFSLDGSTLVHKVDCSVLRAQED